MTEESAASDAGSENARTSLGPPLRGEGDAAPSGPSHAPSNHSAASSQPDMQIERLLNAAPPPVRAMSFYSSHRGHSASAQVPGARALSTHDRAFAGPLHAAPQSFQSAPLVGVPRHLQAGTSLPVRDVLLQSSPEPLQHAFDELRRVTHQFPNVDELNAESGRVVTALFNSTASLHDRNQLWSDWVIFSTLCRSLGVPVFPIQPDKVALVLATHTDLPIAPTLRQLAQYGGAPNPSVVAKVLKAMQSAALATRHLWTDVRCYVRDPQDYESTRVLHEAVARARPSSSFYPANSSFAPPPSPPKPQPPPLVRDVTSRPLLTEVPSAPPAQIKVVYDRDSPSVGPPQPLEKTLRDISRSLSSFLSKLGDEQDDLDTFNLAGERFQQTANSAAFADRVASLHNSALIYTHITSILSFPTYPITTSKLGAFALAMTPGSLGKRLDEAAPELADRRECPRASLKQLETLLKDVTVLRMITRGGDEVIPDEEKSEWTRWWAEITEDAGGPAKAAPAGKRPSQPSKKRVKRSVSPTDSEASTSRARTSAAPTKSKAARQPRSRLHPATEPSSRASSRSNTPSATGSRTAASVYGRKGGSAPSSARRDPSPEWQPPAVFPRWVPEKKGVLPKDRRDPPLPPIMACPWWVPRKKKVKVKTEPAAPAPAAILGVVQDEAVAGGDDSSDEDEEEAKRAMQGRSIALHRPKRGGLDMRPFDVSLLW
ncbi:hypothetical protein JCM10207_004133 [Rhodosporidiobolus poonsookiae]